MSTVMARGGVLHGTMPMRATDPWQRSLAMALRLTDVSIVVLAGFLSYALRFDGDLPNEQVELLALTLGALLAAQCLAIAGCYDERSIDRLSAQLAQAVLGWSAAIGCTLAILFLIKQIDPLSRLWIGSWFVLVVVGLVAVRCLGKQLILRARAKGAFLRRVAIVREPGVPLERILDGIEMNPSLTPVAEMEVDFTDPEQVDAVIREVPRLGQIEQLVLVCNPAHTAALRRIVTAFRQFPIEVNLVAGMLPSELPVIGMRAIGSLPATVLVERPLDGPISTLKDAFDRLVAIGLLTLLAPLMLLVALAIKLDSPGPVLFRQMRVGFDRRPIEVLKFRTMRHELCDAPGAATVKQATRDDHRVTRVGRFLRRSSLDELPQLFNVLKGDMSLVGPRPHAVAHNDHYAALIDGYLGRHRVKPGITGWAQVNGCRGETITVDDMRRRIALDLQYIDNWSLGLDLKILLRTPLVGFVNEKAY
jgi:putative colanic acid biosynthesis UDP-glucose lipid carrier transferase